MQSAIRLGICGYRESVQGRRAVSGYARTRQRSDGRHTEVIVVGLGATGRHRNGPAGHGAKDRGSPSVGREARKTGRRSNRSAEEERPAGIDREPLRAVDGGIEDNVADASQASAGQCRGASQRDRIVVALSAGRGNRAA